MKTSSVTLMGGGTLSALSSSARMKQVNPSTMTSTSAFESEDPAERFTAPGEWCAVLATGP
ncbi:MAG: hypothetical protein U1F56_08000 [Rubrivivax sp.]